MGATKSENSGCKIQDAELVDEGTGEAGAAACAECGARYAQSVDADAAGAAANAVLEDEAADAAGEGTGPPAAARAELAAERDRYLRLAAEYDNFRKRSARERDKIYNDARAEAITRLLPVYDNLERAINMECSDEAFFRGVEMTMTQLTEVLEGMNVVQIPAVGEPFDPNRHNAVMTIVNPELGEKVVAEEFQKGFTLGERVIRHSTVVVAN